MQASGSASASGLVNPFPVGSSLWHYMGSLSPENRALVFEKFRWLESMKSSSVPTETNGQPESSNNPDIWLQALFATMRVCE